jgi:pullulanase
MKPLLADPNLKASKADIMNATAHFQEMLQIRKSSPLFRLATAEEIQNQVKFYNTGANQTPGLIVMAISDPANLDSNYQMVVVVFNALPTEQTFNDSSFEGMTFELHPVQQNSNDPVVKTAKFDAGTFTVPARTTAVFVVAEGTK